MKKIISKKHFFSEKIDFWECESGYRVEKDGVVGWGKISGHGNGEDVGSCKLCAYLCNIEKSCLSYECSPTRLKCNLNDKPKDSIKRGVDYAVCVKGNLTNFTDNFGVLQLVII